MQGMTRKNYRVQSQNKNSIISISESLSVMLVSDSSRRESIYSDSRIYVPVVLVFIPT